jgi:hypothetical protein
MLLDSNAYTWFAKVVVAGEILVGAALILGLFTCIAAFFGGFMNWNFMMAGTASTNPLLFVIAVLLILAWKTAGWWGLDRWACRCLARPGSQGQCGRNKLDLLTRISHSNNRRGRRLFWFPILTISQSQLKIISSKSFSNLFKIERCQFLPIEGKMNNEPFSGGEF